MNLRLSSDPQPHPTLHYVWTNISFPCLTWSGKLSRLGLGFVGVTVFASSRTNRLVIFVISFLIFFSCILPLRASSADSARRDWLARTCQGAGGRGPDATDTISATVAQEPTAYAQAIGVLLIRIVAIALRREHGRCHTRGRVDTCSLCIGKGSNIAWPGRRRIYCVCMG